MRLPVCETKRKQADKNDLKRVLTDECIPGITASSSKILKDYKEKNSYSCFRNKTGFKG